MRPNHTLEQLAELPLFLDKIIPEAYIDRMGHMNVQHYVGLFNESAINMLVSAGLTADYIEQERGGAFALQQHIFYVTEVHAGERVTSRMRAVGRSAKRFHFIQYLINETTGRLACSIEILNSHANLDLRRTSPYPPQIAANLDRWVAEHQALDWEPVLCGAMQV